MATIQAWGSRDSGNTGRHSFMGIYLPSAHVHQETFGAWASVNVQDIIFGGGKTSGFFFLKPTNLGISEL